MKKSSVLGSFEEVRLSEIESKYKYQVMQLEKYYYTRHSNELDKKNLESVKQYAWRQAIRRLEEETETVL